MLLTKLLAAGDAISCTFHFATSRKPPLLALKPLDLLINDIGSQFSNVAGELQFHSQARRGPSRHRGRDGKT